MKILSYLPRLDEMKDKISQFPSKTKTELKIIVKKIRQRIMYSRSSIGIEPSLIGRDLWPEDQAKRLQESSR
jgi:hypothetical protein